MRMTLELVVEELAVVGRRERQQQIQLVERDDEDLRWQQVAGREQDQTVRLKRQRKPDTAKAIIDETNSVRSPPARR